MLLGADFLVEGEKSCYLGNEKGIYQMKDLKFRMEGKEIRLLYEG